MMKSLTLVTFIIAIVGAILAKPAKEIKQDTYVFKTKHEVPVVKKALKEKKSLESHGRQGFDNQGVQIGFGHGGRSEGSFRGGRLIEGGFQQSGFVDGSNSIGGGEEKEIFDYPKYKFAYGVKDPHTGDLKEAWEHRDGDKVVGEYMLLQPDGKIRIVKYEASDKEGFHAIVKLVGKNGEVLEEFNSQAGEEVLGQEFGQGGQGFGQEGQDFGQGVEEFGQFSQGKFGGGFQQSVGDGLSSYVQGGKQSGVSYQKVSKKVK